MSGTLTRHNETGLSDSCLYINSCSSRGATQGPPAAPAIKKKLKFNPDRVWNPVRASFRGELL